MSDGTANGEKNITKYFYSNGGIQTKMETGLNSANDSDYMTTNYAYDAWGHLVNTTDSTGYNSGTTTYDLNGNVLTVTDANGTEKVLCDLGGEHMAKSVMTFVGVILFMSIVTTIVVLQFIRSRRAYFEK